MLCYSGPPPIPFLGRTRPGNTTSEAAPYLHLVPSKKRSMSSPSNTTPLLSRIDTSVLDASSLYRRVDPSRAASKPAQPPRGDINI